MACFAQWLSGYSLFNLDMPVHIRTGKKDIHMNNLNFEKKNINFGMATCSPSLLT